jgi:adenine-specific DNA-methyltransferase
MPKETRVDDYRYDDHRRKNIPEAGPDSPQQKMGEGPGRQRYAYDPHLPPVLRFDETGRADRLTEELDSLLVASMERPLTPEEAERLEGALMQRQPWLEWAGKREARWFEVDPVALHIHERISAQAIIKLAQREPTQRSLWADPELEYRQSVQYYQHEVGWSNRLILGDSAQVMASLAEREGLAGKVQMLYMDPPYGINYRSNFQSLTDRRDVADRDQDLTREAEQIKAYRDTWVLGVHSYLGYMRQRLSLARVLLADEGSVFVQISDENLHRVRCLMDELFGPEQFVRLVHFRKTGALSSQGMDEVGDYLIWFAKDRRRMVYNQLFLPKEESRSGLSNYSTVQLADGSTRRMTAAEGQRPDTVPTGARLFGLHSLSSQSGGASTQFPIKFEGREYRVSSGGWKTNSEGMRRLGLAGRLGATQKRIGYRRYYDDFSLLPLNNLWNDTRGEMNVRYVVQTAEKIIERCMLMTTRPGDLVVDPTCGSGTTAYAAEKWGRRWISIDTSRVAVALARQRLLTSRLEYYRLADSSGTLSGGFALETVPHIQLQTIAQNMALDRVFEQWEPTLVERLSVLNATLPQVDGATRTRLLAKLAQAEQSSNKSSVTDADRRRWVLPKERWNEWEVPFDADEDWPQALKDALVAYRTAWRAKMDEVNATIAASAPQEILYDQPEVEPDILRVSGPFTVEAVRPVEPVLDEATPIGGEPEALDTFGPDSEPQNAEAFIEKMVHWLQSDGVRFPNNVVQRFARLDLVTGRQTLHAEGEWVAGEAAQRVGVSVGPEAGPITVSQVNRAVREASLAGYDALVLVGMAFDAEAQAAIDDPLMPDIQCHMAHIRPDVVMGDLLKETPTSQLFTVFGQPRVAVHTEAKGEISVELEGVDIYDPLTNALQATGASKVAAWFVDHDYNGRTFCVSQAFFPDRSAWEPLARALRSVVDSERFEAFSGTRSLPFQPGERVAVKVIDPRGNEVMKLLRMDEARHD